MYVCKYFSFEEPVMEEPVVREWVCASHRVGLQKLTTLWGTFDTYKRGAVTRNISMPLLYVSIESVCVCTKQVDCVWKRICLRKWIALYMIWYRRFGGIGSGQRVILPSDVSSWLLVFFLLFSNEASGLSMIHTRPRRKHDRMCMCRGD